MSLASILRILNRNESLPQTWKTTLRDALTALYADTANTVTGVGLVRADGTTPLTADWDVGAFDITAKRLISDVATGTAPLTVASTTVVTNLKADTVVTNANLTGVVTSTGNATAIANGVITNAMMANAAVANLSGTNTGDQANVTGNAGTVTTNANLTGPITSVGNATTITNNSVGVSKIANGTDGELITWDSSGVATTVAVGTSGHILTSNGAGQPPTFQLGVDFSANAGTAATGAATTGEELSHYEEGTWTPNLWDLSFSSGEGQTYTQQEGRFTRIGNIVFISGIFDMTSIGTLASLSYIGPLPYTSANIVAPGTISIGTASDLSTTAGYTIAGTIAESVNYIALSEWDAATGTTAVSPATITAIGKLIFSGFYFV